MENLANNNNGRRFPAGNQANVLLAGNHYQLTMNMHESMIQFPNNLGYWVSANALRARGSGVGWAEGQPTTTVPSTNFDIISFRNPQWQPQQPVISNSGNGMYRTLSGGVPPPPLAVVPESTIIPMSVPMPMPMPVESEHPMRIRKKAAKRWSPEEHKLFLIGLKKYKKGDWKSISRTLVVTRSPTQVASHAQKYYNRQEVEAEVETTASDGSTRKKRSSIHDTKVEDVSDDPDEVKSLQDIINAQHSKSTSPERRSR